MKNEILKRIFSSIVLIPLTLYVIIKGSLYFYIFLVIIFLISSYEWFKMSKNKFYNLYGYFFLLFSIFCTHQLRFIFDNNFWPIIIVTGICVFTDIGGYTFGKIFKGPKLVKYSPNKTYSGLIGSFLFSLFLVPILFLFNLISYNQVNNFILFIIVISATSQFGDIVISYFKRISNIKDTGNLIPGHGGLLDRIDGMLFAFPVSYLLFQTNLINYYS